MAQRDGEDEDEEGLPSQGMFAMLRYVSCAVLWFVICYATLRVVCCGMVCDMLCYASCCMLRSTQSLTRSLFLLSLRSLSSSLPFFLDSMSRNRLPPRTFPESSSAYLLLFVMSRGLARLLFVMSRGLACLIDVMSRGHECTPTYYFSRYHRCFSPLSLSLSLSLCLSLSFCFAVSLPINHRRVLSLRTSAAIASSDADMW